MSNKRTGKKSKKVTEPKTAVKSTDATAQRVAGVPSARVPSKPSQ